jgi:hypothetical protein
VIDNSVADATTAIDRLMASHGWSLWGVELRSALGPVGIGAEAQRRWVSELQASVPNSVPGLILQIISDRNDPSLSYEVFHANCTESFPRFAAVIDWLPNYLYYRTLASFERPERDFAIALCRDMTSSLFDYYETVVEVVKGVVNEDSLEGCRPTALRLVDALIKDGFDDHRLYKLSTAISGRPQTSETFGSNDGESQISLFLANRDGTTSIDPLSIGTRSRRRMLQAWRCCERRERQSSALRNQFPRT